MKAMRGNYLDIAFEQGEFDGIITDGPTRGAIKNFNAFMAKAFNDTRPYGFMIVLTSMFDVPYLVYAGNAAGWKLHEKQIWAVNVMTDKSGKLNTSHVTRDDVQFILYFSKGVIPPGQPKIFTWWKGLMISAYKRTPRSGGGFSMKPFEGKYSFPIYDEILDDAIHLDKERTSPTYGQAKPQAETKYQDGTIVPILRFEKIDPIEKPIEFSWLFKQIISGVIVPKELRKQKKKTSNEARPVEKFILDPYMGKGNLLVAFPNSIGIIGG